jgi:2-polyprenyl-3-methyl-5-hydroxy-6-metoxy-1,4-benzoquinol methylase
MLSKIPLVQRVDFIVEACAGKSVLHLGCTNYPYTVDAIEKGMLLHHRLARVADELYGFDFDQEGLNILAAGGTKDLYRADLEDLASVPLDRTFDVIVAGEMIEHLANPGLFLKGIRRFMVPETKLLITTVNAYSAARFLTYSLKGKGGHNEPVHPDHVAYFSFKTLSKMVEKGGLAVRDFYYYDIGPEHRPTNRAIVNWVNDISVRFAPHLADGVIAICGLPSSNGRSGQNSTD